MRITERFEAINCKPEEMFFEQISQVEKLLEEKGYICTERFSYGTYNLFYHKEGETVVFVTYYNTHNKVVLVLCQDLVQVKMRNFFPF